MTESQPERPIHQPIPPDILARLDPEYAAFHNAVIRYVIPSHLLPWDPTKRTLPSNGASEPSKVGEIRDIPLDRFVMRIFTPEGTAPQGGWPLILYFHGGGWVMGDIATENTFCTHMCKRASCVVVSVAYRLAPEHPYPAAVEDAVEALRWVHENGATQLSTNVKRIAVGGCSSGGNLAAVLTHKAALLQPPIPLVFQLLIVPCTDNTANVDDPRYLSWSENKNTIGLFLPRLLFFREKYVPNTNDRHEWECSPILAPEEDFRKLPKAWIGVAELDLLRDEAVAYGEKLKQAGVEAEVNIYKGSPHTIMGLDGIQDFISVMRFMLFFDVDFEFILEFHSIAYLSRLEH
ncbi:uncharacterized protein FIBRA_07565 [Fibroporia radiculosa]|uniref:Alpha/beta hydrolase fold-3 domain-containing protein n=1 Tax=Fibroporia radiculosa TaxID=599839 RepID=J4IBW1_9APHY|nr:uncharacterized protein FIBRA_07565 [Fibroporia radiculosa]CCM05351.1 predicted protein [Fibroporia radiculosa]